MPPPGWARASLAVIDYPPRTNANPGDQDILVLKQIWQVPGTDRANDQASWAGRDVRRKMPNETATKPARTLLRTLDDGTQICGSGGSGTIGADPDTSPTIEVTHLEWSRSDLDLSIQLPWHRLESGT